MNKVELFEKIKRLADKGVGGEKDNATKILNNLMFDYIFKGKENKQEYINNLLQEFESLKDFVLKMDNGYWSINNYGELYILDIDLQDCINEYIGNRIIELSEKE